jgi:hypothetical protein
VTVVTQTLRHEIASAERLVGLQSKLDGLQDIRESSQAEEDRIQRGLIDRGRRTHGLVSADLAVCVFEIAGCVCCQKSGTDNPCFGAE